MGLTSVQAEVEYLGYTAKARRDNAAGPYFAANFRPLTGAVGKILILILKVLDNTK